MVNMDYVFVNDKGEKSKIYSPGVMIEYEDGRKISAEDIFVNYAGEIAAKVDDKIVVLDTYPYYSKLIKAGYFVYKDYDKERVESPEEGVELRKELLHLVMEKLYNIVKELPDFEDLSNDNEYRFSDSSNRYIVKLDTVSSIVYKNMDRKDNNLKFYPYDKDVDKYGCIYLRIYSQCMSTTDDNNDAKSRRYASKIIRKALLDIGAEYHFRDLPVRTRIVYNNR